MKRTISTTVPAALVAAAFLAPPALAQERDHVRGRGNQQSEGRATERAQPQQQRTEAPRVESRRDVAVPRPEVVGPRGGYAPRYEPRYEQRYEPRHEQRFEPRYSPRYEAREYYRPYAFRPRFSIGFGIFAGYPVPYSYAYPSPYAVAGSPAAYYGGVTLEITPQNAAVYVDGSYAGIVGDFNGSRQPLTLTAGTHRIEVQEQGLAPLVFDVTVQPGQVIPYQGDLRPY